MPRNKSPELLASRIVPTKLEHLNDVVVGTGEPFHRSVNFVVISGDASDKLLCCSIDTYVHSIFTYHVLRQNFVTG